MAKLVARYDASTVEETVLSDLVAAGASDAAMALAAAPTASQVSAGSLHEHESCSCNAL
jgi:hypothetical protein